MLSNKEVIQNWRNDADAFEASGGNVALFWAGKMSQLAQTLVACYTSELSSTIQILDLVRIEYDAVILDFAKKAGRTDGKGGSVS